MSAAMSVRAAELKGDGLTLMEIAQTLAQEFDGKVRSRERVRQLVAKGQRVRDVPDPEGWNQLRTQIVYALRLEGIDTRAQVNDWIIRKKLMLIPNIGAKSIAEIYAWMGYKPPQRKTVQQMTGPEFVRHLVERRRRGEISSSRMATLAYQKGRRDGLRVRL
jgi:hypothetical protein